ncbi:hypothetical protein BUE93_09235 [Chromobacterium amazonense]|uniref:Bacterial type II secretion system protein E domain-containing protein n=1 Tax=Chromobacterium amazonense TaxID=1382803 RepID=A0A2S9X5F6_9NEIS|nr:ATPase, T2SS/T4P/T4SS family [Chromobacterium amazonense]PRP70949.1 hypothetical protein BUE93_09235 [Chromobacterium amazonense]
MDDENAASGEGVAPQGNRLRDLEFTDLIIGPDGQGHLRYAEGLGGPIVAVPSAYLADLQRLIDMLHADEREREYFLHYDGVPYRVASIGTIKGRTCFLRRPKLPLPTLDSLGMPRAMWQMLFEIGQSSGMVLFSGATGSGKTTSMYALLRQLLTACGDIAVAVEDPPEIPMQGIYGDRGQGLWYQIDARAVGGYENAMVAAMRYNPRFILLGEIREPQVAHEAIRAAVNGHLVLATIHGSSLSGAIMALQQVAAASSSSQELARSILADGLAAVVHQQLRPDPVHPGRQRLHAEILCFGNDTGLRAKVRNGKLEQLSTEIETQRLRIQRGQRPLPA